jgi:hypothetical protein
MISTRDEIIRKFAAELDEDGSEEYILPISEEDVSKWEEQVGDPEETVGIKTPVEPEQKKPISVRDVPRPPSRPSDSTEWPWDEPVEGSPEWMAQYNTRMFLRGVNKPYRGYVREPRVREVTEKTMNKLVDEFPNKFFAWNLYKLEELKDWLIPAAESYIEKDPYRALLERITTEYKELRHLQPKLWEILWEREMNRPPTEETSEVFPGILRNQAKSLAGEIAKSHPEFFQEHIANKGTLIESKFKDWAERALRAKQGT